MQNRGKSFGKAYMAFQYGDEKIFSQNIRHAGYDDFRTIAGDASTFDWSRVGPVGCMHLDIDLYLPTLKILRGVWDHLVEGGGVVVDDCLPDSPYDGALQAYEEFIAEKGLPFRRSGSKGGLVIKS